MNPSKLRVFWIAVAAVWIILTVAPFLAPVRSPLNCSYEDIDLSTGRVRYTQMLYWMPVSRGIRNSSISGYSYGRGSSTFLDHQGGNWVRVHTFSKGIPYSRGHDFQNALRQTEFLGEFWAKYDVSTEVRKEYCLRVLKLWGDAGDDSGVQAYIETLQRLEMQLENFPNVEPIEGDTTGQTSSMIMIDVLRDGNIEIDGVMFGLEQFVATVKSLKAIEPGLIFLIRADREVRQDMIHSIVSSAVAVGVDNIDIRLRPLR